MPPHVDRAEPRKVGDSWGSRVGYSQSHTVYGWVEWRLALVSLLWGPPVASAADEAAHDPLS